MKRLWLMSVIVLAGCQPETPKTPVEPVATPAVAPVVATPVAVSPTPQAAAVPTQQKAPTDVPAQTTAKSVQVVQPKTNVVAEPVKTPTATAEVEAPKVVAPLPQPVASPQQPAISEEQAMALAKKKNCFACHALDRKVVGPAWKDVAAKYRGDSGAQTYMENRIAKGGKGVWGSVAMPPQPALSRDELALLVRFILNLK